MRYLFEVCIFEYDTPLDINVEISPFGCYAMAMWLGQLHSIGIWFIFILILIAFLPPLPLFFLTWIVFQRSIGLPDVHSGYGFAIGNMAAFDMSDPEAVVSPGMDIYSYLYGKRTLRYLQICDRCVRLQFKGQLYRDIVNHSM